MRFTYMGQTHVKTMAAREGLGPLSAPFPGSAGILPASLESRRRLRKGASSPQPSAPAPTESGQASEREKGPHLEWFVGSVRVCASRNSGWVRAFTLLEMVGVLAVLSILAAALAPVVIKRMDIAALNGETSSLSAMKDALTQYIIKSNTIPDQTTWAQAIGGELGLAAANITTTPRNLSRAFLIDNSGWFGTASGALPYVQPAGGVPSSQQAAGPAGARLMIVSSIGKALPVSSGAPGTATFNAIWNTSWPNVPSTGTGWGSGSDLVIQRINVEPLFHRVILVDSGGGQGYYSISTNTAAPVPLGGAGVNTYYLDGTPLNLSVTNSAGTNLVVQEIIRSDMSRVYEGGLWRDGPLLGLTNPPPVGSTIGALATLFSGITNYASSNNGATPQTALDAMISYMDAYTMWANMTPCFSFNGAGGIGNGKFPPYQILEGNNGKNSVAQWLGSNLSP